MKAQSGRPGPGNLWRKLLRLVYRKMLQSMDWGERRIRPGFRWLVGVMFIIGGVLGFLPVLGFWMIPVGITYIVLEFPKNRARLRAYLVRKTEALSQSINESGKGKPGP